MGCSINEDKNKCVISKGTGGCTMCPAYYPEPNPANKLEWGAEQTWYSAPQPKQETTEIIDARIMGGQLTGCKFNGQRGDKPTTPKVICEHYAKATWFDHCIHWRDAYQSCDCVKEKK